MPSIDELNGGGFGNTPLAQALAAGVGDISYQQEVTFHLYYRVILPLDGYLFWVRAGANGNGTSSSSSSGQINAFQLNTAQLNQSASNAAAAGGGLIDTTISVKGSLHIVNEFRSEMEATHGAGHVIFTTMEELSSFTEVSPITTWIGEFEGQKFSIGARASFYRQANLYHYTASVLSPFMATQVVDDPRTLDPLQVIVSNSLPAWLAINSFKPDWPVPMPFPKVPLYPSFLVEQNILPPYGVIHIDPAGTEGMQMAPFLDSTMGHSQLARDRVGVTLYGCNNAVASTWFDCLMQYSFDTQRFGIMNYTTALLDDKELQPDFYILSQKKRLIFDISYNQATIRSIARQMIEEIKPPTNVIGLVDAPVAQG